MTDADPAPPEPATEPGRHRVVLAAVLAAAIALLIVGVFAVMDQGNADNPAIRACEAWVDDQLVAPATAKFSHEQAYLTGGSPEVTGDVDAQNEYGALLRSTFSCDMAGSGGDWTVTDGYVT